jgi:predicted RNA binding protein YcfA (HicA-like mRNA interferase family)
LNIPRGITARDLTRALESDGFILNRTAGSHHIYTQRDGRVVPVAYTRQSDTFPIGTLRSMIRLARWTEADLRRLHLTR